MKRIRTLAGRITRRAVAQTLVLAGAAGVAFGAALVYRPAGVVIAGVLLAVWALLLFDVDAGR